jgi:hypothetical protein
VLRVLEPSLRMKAQTDSNSRGQKDFICREEKRKTAYWGMQGDLETGDPMGQGGEWSFIAFLHCLMAEMPFRYRWAFPREKCLLGLPRSVLHHHHARLTEMRSYKCFAWAGLESQSSPPTKLLG